MANVQKIIIVGEPETGKTSLIQCFLDYDGELNNQLIDGKDSKPKQHNIINPNSDFSLKIINIGGEKARLQLWDQGLSKDPKSVFQPLFTRHTAGCIVVANTMNLQTIKKAPYWKQIFDQTTKVADEPSYPCTLFINHHDSVPWDDQQRLQNLEQQAGEAGNFYGIYHLSVGDPNSVYLAFEGFVSRIMDESSQFQRTNTEQFLVDEHGNATVKFRQSREGNSSMYSAGGGLAKNQAKNKGKAIQEENTFSKDLGNMQMPPEDGTFKLSRSKSASNAKKQRKCCKSQ